MPRDVLSGADRLIRLAREGERGEALREEVIRMARSGFASAPDGAGAGVQPGVVFVAAPGAPSRKEVRDAAPDGPDVDDPEEAALRGIPAS